MEKRHLGQYFTPISIVNQILGNLPNFEQIANKTLLEPSFGNGAFLIGLLYHYQSQTSIESLHHWFTHNVYGYEIEPVAYKEAIDSITQWFAKYELSFNNHKLIQADAVFSLMNNNQQYDYCIGNPPYVQAKYIDRAIKPLLSQLDSGQSGKTNLYYAFVELCFKCSQELCFIIPNSFLYNTGNGAKYIKSIIEQYSQSPIINFQHEKMFEDADTYSCIIHLNKNTSQKVSINNKPKFQHNIVLKSIPAIATLCNRAYYIDNPNLFPKKEQSIIHNLLSYQSNQWIIMPYHQGVIIEENTLLQQYPIIYQHLTQYKEELLKRDAGKAIDYPHWYQYGRSQGLNNSKGIKNNQLGCLVFSTAYKPNECEYQWIENIDINQVYLKNGCAFVVDTEDKGKVGDLLCFLQSNEFKDYLVNHSTPIASGYFQVKSSVLKSILMK